MSFAQWTQRIYGCTLDITKYDPEKVCEFIEKYHLRLKRTIGNDCWEEWGFQDIVEGHDRMTYDEKCIVVRNLFYDYENEEGNTFGPIQLIADMFCSAGRELGFDPTFIDILCGTDDYPFCTIGVIPISFFPWELQGLDSSTYAKSGITKEKLEHSIRTSVEMLFDDNYLMSNKPVFEDKYINYYG